MTAQSSNIAAAYWRQKDARSPIKENRQENKVNNLIISIKDLLLDKNITISDAFSSLFDDIFSLRIESLSLIKNDDLAIEEIFDSIYEDFENREVPEKYELLNENVLFSIRTTSKISRNIILNNNKDGVIDSLEEVTTRPDSSDKNWTTATPYKDLVNSIKLISQQLPNNSLLQLIELTNNSLITELGIISADIIFDNCSELEFSANKIKELNEVIVEAAQEYGALALELGLVQKNRKRTSQVVPNEIDNEDQFLAELGVSDFLNQIDSNDE